MSLLSNNLPDKQMWQRQWKPIVLQVFMYKKIYSCQKEKR